MKNRARTFILASLVLPHLAFGATTEQTPRFNDLPLKGVAAYSVVAVVAPRLARITGLESEELKSRAESVLEEAGLLKSEGDSPVASVFFMVSFTPPQADHYGWHVVIEVRERSRLERAPDAGIVMAVTWHQSAMGVSSGTRLGSTLTGVIDRHTRALVAAHKRGGPATR